MTSRLPHDSVSREELNNSDDLAQSCVLIVDDEPIARSSLKALLGMEDYNLLIAEDGISALEMLEEYAIDLVLLDIMMPKMDGYEVCRRIRATPGLAEVPVVMITALDDRDSKLKGIEAGADDFISKPYDGIELRARCRGITRLNRYRRIVNQTERLAYLEDFDPVTDLPNRNLLNSRISQALAKARRTKEGVSIAILDLDNFDRITQGLGVDNEGVMLQHVAERLLRSVRGRDTIARIGSDRFVILQESITPTHDVANAVQRIHLALEKPFRVADTDIVMTGSIGISLYPADGESTHILLHNAMNAMLAAKKQGKNNYQFFSAELNVAAIKRLTMESELRHALENEEFLLHFQPQVDLLNNKIVGMEALVRWEHPDRGLISPAEFIGLAEETGLIEQIGEWVLRSSCYQVQAWYLDGLPVPKVSVNVSSRQFHLKNFVSTVADILEETQLNPSLLELELTESLLMPDSRMGINGPINTLKKIKAMGISLSIDDFGTGYSSLSYLQQFPVDVLKVDRSFIKDFIDHHSDMTVATSIIQLAHNLNLKVIAEGVETEAQLLFLEDRGCDLVQGYLFSRPIPSTELEKLLREKNGMLFYDKNKKLSISTTIETE